MFMKLYLNPIYTTRNKYPKRNKWIRVFVIVILIHLIGFAYYLNFKKDKNILSDDIPSQTSQIIPKQEIDNTISKNKINEDYSSIIDLIENNELENAYNLIISKNCESKEIIDLFCKANMNNLIAKNDKFNKTWYVVQSGDSLSKIKNKFNTTIELIKLLNDRKTDLIRVGERLLVFKGSNKNNENTFSINVSKSKNTLDLMLNQKLFKRYPVGTGKFGKTPEVDFFVYDKIEEPPWTRPSDNKVIEYGDPENVLGTRWFALKSPTNPELTGFGIHGTWERDSIGYQSSDGCVRMFNEDVEELFKLIPRNTIVKIVQ